MTRFLPPYLDLDAAYPRPSTGAVSNVGWWRQAAYCADEMWHTFDIQGGPQNYAGALESADTAIPWIGVTLENTSGRAGYIQVGDICYFSAYAQAALGVEQAGIALPLPAARTSMATAGGRGEFAGNQLFGRIEGQALMLYTTVGRLDHASAGSPTSGNVLHVQGRYRCVTPPPGRLTQRTHVVTEQA